MDKHYLSPLFQPESIVIFTGNPDQVEQQTACANTLSQALRAQRFSGTLTFLDIHTSGTLADLAHTRADLAIIALPPTQAIEALEVAGRIKCRAALVLGDGIAVKQAAELRRVAQLHGMYLLGPNSTGLQRPSCGLNASVSGPLVSNGSLALVSQSGALTASILDWAGQNAVGFSTVVTIGKNAAVDIDQVLDFLASDAKTHSIVIYLEGISNARRFMSALRAAASIKPVVVLKAGRKRAGNLAAKTHSGAIVGSDDVFEAALRRAGAVRVRSFVELFSAAKCLASRYLPVGRRLAIITNGGGPGVLAADWISEIGLELGRLCAEKVLALQPKLSELASLSDLIDLGEEASPAHYQAAIEAATSDSTIDGVLVVHSPKPGVDAVEVARVLTNQKARQSKPLLCCWMGDISVLQGRIELNNANIPSFRTPEAAVGAFGNIANFYQNQQLLQQTPSPLSSLAQPDIEGARLLIENVLSERRKVLTEMESKALLSTFHIPVTQTILARNSNEAMMIASQLGYPVALKIDSPDINHKSDVDGVVLNVLNAVDVRDSYNQMIQSVGRWQPSARINGITIQKMANSKRGREINIGLVTDDIFGPVIAFGAGGTMIELINDRTMELPPLNQFLARRLIERSRVAETLGDWRGANAINREALERVLLRVSEMVCELPQLREMDINPIIVDQNGAVAVDARIVVDSAPTTARNYAHLAILPYPARYEQVWPLRGGGSYTIRPIHPDDAQMLQELMRSLSSETRYFRFISSAREHSPAMLSRLTLIDYDREMALVAIYREIKQDENASTTTVDRIVGVSRYITNPDKTSCEFSLVVADDFAGKGLGARLMLSIMEEARDKGLSAIEGLVLANNSGMLKLMKSLGFSITTYGEDPDFKWVSRYL